VASTTVVAGNSVVLAPGQVGTSIAACPAGQIVTGGGWTTNGGINISEAHNSKLENGWAVIGVNNAQFTTAVLTTHVICAAP
jgi:hypothetical protein